MNKNILLITLLLFVFGCTSKIEQQIELPSDNQKERHIKANFIKDISLNKSEPIYTLAYLNNYCAIKIEIKKINQDKKNYNNATFNTTQIKPLVIKCLVFEDKIIKKNVIKTIYNNKNVFKKDQELIFLTDDKKKLDFGFTKKTYDTDPKLIHLCGVKNNFKKNETIYDIEKIYSQKCQEYTNDTLKSFTPTLKHIQTVFQTNNMNDIFENDYFQYLSYYMDTIRFLTIKKNIDKNKIVEF